MIAGIVVVGTIALAAAFCLAWLARPALRRWIEAPKHTFQSSLQQYDRQQRRASDERGRHGE